MYARVFYILHTETKKTSRQGEAKEERVKKKTLVINCTKHVSSIIWPEKKESNASLQDVRL